MRDGPFDARPEFRRFKEAMRGILSVSKTRLDELVEAAKEDSPRNGDPHAPGRKTSKRKRKKE